MKLSQSLNDALNQQILHEYRNMLAYKQIEAFFEDLQLKKLAKYFADQAQHEKEHGDLFLGYINDRVGGKVMLENVLMPKISLNDCVSAGFEYLKIEEETTESIEDIYDLALEEKSFIDLPFLQKMLEEQVEEEDSALEFFEKVKSVKDYVLFDATF